MYIYKEVKMEDKIDELMEEIDILSRKVEILEKKENNRKAFSYVRLLVKIIVILLSAYGIWRGYEYIVNETPKIIEEKIREINPLNNE